MYENRTKKAHGVEEETEVTVKDPKVGPYNNLVIPSLLFFF